MLFPFLVVNGFWVVFCVGGGNEASQRHQQKQQKSADDFEEYLEEFKHEFGLCVLNKNDLKQIELLQLEATQQFFLLFIEQN